jgi:hypothetical protein
MDFTVGVTWQFARPRKNQQTDERAIGHLASLEQTIKTVCGVGPVNYVGSNGDVVQSVFQMFIPPRQALSENLTRVLLFL